MTVEELLRAMEKMSSGLASSGFENVDPETMEKLREIALTAGELHMKEGKHLTENVITCIKAIQDGRSKVQSGYLRLTALDFYLKNFPYTDFIEDI